MKKYLVIGNPISHSLSPRLHNSWLKQNNINAKYEKTLAWNDPDININWPIKNPILSDKDKNKNQSLRELFKL